MYIIYCHEFPNGKRYVGITKNTLSKRISGGYSSCPLMQRAIDKYGWENIRSRVIESVETLEMAEEKEKYYIRLYNTMDSKNGYNILPGGDVSKCEITDEMRYKLGKGNRGRIKTDSEKAKISLGVKKVFSRPSSNGHYGMTMTEETKRKMSESQTKAWFDEKRRADASDRMTERMSDESYKSKVLNALSKCRRKKGEWSMPESAKQKLKDYNTGKWVGSNSPCSKPVLQFTKEGVFVKRWDCASDPDRAGIAKRSNICKCCNKKCKSAGGYIWKFENSE